MRPDWKSSWAAVDRHDVAAVRSHHKARLRGRAGHLLGGVAAAGGEIHRSCEACRQHGSAFAGGTPSSTCDPFVR